MYVCIFKKTQGEKTRYSDGFKNYVNNGVACLNCLMARNHAVRLRVRVCVSGRVISSPKHLGLARWPASIVASGLSGLSGFEHVSI